MGVDPSCDDKATVRSGICGTENRLRGTHPSLIVITTDSDSTRREFVKNSTALALRASVDSEPSDTESYGADDIRGESDSDRCEELFVRTYEGGGKEQQLVLRETEEDELSEERSNLNGALVVVNKQCALVQAPKYNGYQHCFITVADEHRFLMLYTFLKRNDRSKIVIFFSTTRTTQYYAKILERLKFDVISVHNGQKKDKFLDGYFEFAKRDSGILCIPDFQGNEYAIPPSVHWIIQFEPPGNPSEYMFRVGRVCKEDGFAAGKALLFLGPQEFGFLKYFNAAQCNICEYEVPKLANIQNKYERLVSKDIRLRVLALEAYHAHLMNYARHDFRDIYNVHALDKGNVASAFGFPESPTSSGIEEDNAGVERSRRENEVKQEKQWKPTKERSNGWMTKEKSWRHSGRHATIKPQKSTNERFAVMKPKSTKRIKGQRLTVTKHTV